MIKTKGKLAIFAGLLVSAPAFAATFQFQITNGGAMPISPGVIYASNEAAGTSEVGQPATPGLVQLCQTGNNAVKAAELRATHKVGAVVETTGPIMPGETRQFEIMAPAGTQSLHFETMYGKTKDVCGSVTVSKHGLTALSQHVTAAVTGKDQVIASGAFTEPLLTAYPDTMCANAANGVGCLRALSQPVSGAAVVRDFTGYLPSVLTYIESKYGSEDALSLQVPTAGTVHYAVKLKH